MDLQRLPQKSPTFLRPPPSPHPPPSAPAVRFGISRFPRLLTADPYQPVAGDDPMIYHMIW